MTITDPRVTTPAPSAGAARPATTGTVRAPRQLPLTAPHRAQER